MATFRQALRTLDANLLHKTYQQWLRKQVNQERVERATLELAAIAAHNKVISYGTFRQARWSSRHEMDFIEKLPPEIIYHLWFQERQANPYQDSRQFPIPVKKATQYLKLMELFVFQLLNDDEATWKGYYGELTLAADEVATWLLKNMELLPIKKSFPVDRLGAHPMFRLEHAERLLALISDHALYQIADNQNLDDGLLQWVWEMMEENISQHGGTVLDRLSRNTSPVITNAVLEKVWDFYIERFNKSERKYLSVAQNVADNPACSEELLVRIAERGHLSGMPKDREVVPENVINILLRNNRTSTRRATIRDERAAPYMEQFLDGPEESKLDMWANAALNPAVDPAFMIRLAQHRTINVRSHLAKNTSVTVEAAEMLAFDRSRTVRKQIAYNRAVPGHLRLLAEPTERQMVLCLKADREKFLDWLEAKYPDLAGLPENFLIQVVPTLVIQEVEMLRAEMATKEFI